MLDAECGKNMCNYTAWIHKKTLDHQWVKFQIHAYMSIVTVFQGYVQMFMYTTYEQAASHNKLWMNVNVYHICAAHYKWWKGKTLF